ncbi:MAG: hypothetical protein ACK462_08190, partial [Planctomyces sp.]
MLTTICNSTWSVMRLVLVAVLMVLAVPVSAARGQCAAGWLPGQGLPGMDGAVTALAVLPGGDLIVGGSFGTAGGVAASNIARYNPSTNTWSALGSGTSGTVNALAVLPGGDVIVGGSFGTAGRVAASNIARYNPTTNTWSALGSGTNSTVSALAVLPGGDVIVGGSFTLAGGVAASKSDRSNPSTKVWKA